MHHVSECFRSIFEFFICQLLEIVVNALRILFVTTAVIMLIENFVKIPQYFAMARCIIAVHKVSIECVAKDVHIEILGLLLQMLTVTAGPPTDTVTTHRGPCATRNQTEMV